MAFKEGIEKRFLAEAGIERAITELFYAVHYRGQTALLEEKEVWRTDGTSYEGQLGNGRYSVAIIDESGKIDINKITEQSGILLKNLLMNHGVRESDADIIVDSLFDWRDADDLRHLNGAEDEYYLSLPSPYKAKNANFDTVEEILLIKGMTSEILYGGGEMKGVIQYLTVNGPAPQININAAPRDVLMAVPGITPEIADSIISLRETRQVTPQDAGIPGESAAFVSYAGGNTFTIESRGHRGGEGGYAIRATVVIEGNNKHRYVYYKAPADIKQ
jgi:general secretion pathway protein K